MAFSVGPLASRPATLRKACASDVPNVQRQTVPAVLNVGRRTLLAAIGLAPAVVDSIAFAGVAPNVGTYLPLAGIDDLVLFKPNNTKTPAIRAGTVDPLNPYTFALPPNFSEKQVANIASGNYCQPKCGEPWTEVIFSNDKMGSASVIAAPLVKMTNMKNAKITDVGNTEGFLDAVGPFITGTYLDQEDVITMESATLEDGFTYYYYDIYATYGLKGPHTLTACAVKGDLCLLFCVAASDKQWATSEKKLRSIWKTFRA